MPGLITTVINLDGFALKAEIEAKFGSVYRFCGATGLCKSMVYLVLRNVYPGDVAMQVARIRAAIAKEAGPGRLERAVEAIRATACAQCQTLGGYQCRHCHELFHRQAQAVCLVLEG